MTRNLIDLNDFTIDEWEEIIQLAKDIQQNPAKYQDYCKRKIMATLFYEPSTRTQMSFQTAMYRLGGEVIGFDNPVNTSVAKGESLKDTIKIISGYADLIVMRHPLEGAAKAASEFSNCPVINAGDGGHLHPTQTLTDLLTLYEEKGKINGLVIGICGDLKNGRTVHSLVKALMCYENTSFVFISTPTLTLPDYLKNLLDQSGCRYVEMKELSNAMPIIDVLYMTRIQRERFDSEIEYQSQKNIYILDNEKLISAKNDLKILHPLPRVDEIDIAVDEDERAIYFKQAIYGVYARTALIIKMLEKNKEDKSPDVTSLTKRCVNPKCITNPEKYLKNSFYDSNGVYRCLYCDHEIR